ncbi:MAG TPA: hypothetical protein VKB52_07225 [Rhodanobacteraceae bacterium]|nr:hypothetical protein [Rhodanobacteraceae bacterium]
MKHRMCLCAAFLSGLARAAFAADGDLDPTFSADGQALVSWPYSIGGAEAAVADDGSIFHGTTEARQAGADVNLDFAISKFRPDGSPDTTFGFFGLRTVGFDVIANGSDSLLGVFPQPGGGVLLAGRVQMDEDAFGYRAPGLIRLTPAGDADASFGDDGRRVIAETPWPAPNEVQIGAVARQPDGKFVFAGVCFHCAGTRLVVAVRLTASGDLDPTFGEGGWFGFDVQSGVDIGAVAIDAWGRIVLGGADETDADPDDRPWLMRLTPSGQPDATFGGGGISFLQGVPSFGSDWFVPSVAIDGDGSIVLALDNGGAGVARAHEDGSLDTAFADNGFLDLEREDGAEIRAVAIRGDHRIVVAGGIDHTGGNYDQYVARLRPDGSLDDDFAGNGLLRIDMIAGADDSASAIAFDAGRPLIVGRGGADIDTGTLLRLQSDLIFASGCGD